MRSNTPTPHEPRPTKAMSIMDRPPTDESGANSLSSAASVVSPPGATDRPPARGSEAAPTRFVPDRNRNTRYGPANRPAGEYRTAGRNDPGDNSPRIAVGDA